MRDRLDVAVGRFLTVTRKPAHTLIHADARDALVAPWFPTTPIRSIICSPPYYGQRDYPGVGKQFWSGRSWISQGPCKDEPRFDLHPGKQIMPSPMILHGGQNEYVTCRFCRGLWVQLGLEPTIDLYLAHIVEILGLCKRVLADDGTLWVVIGDSYAGSGRGPSGANANVGNQAARQGFVANKPFVPRGMKPKDLMDIPHQLGAALRDDDWYWRSDIIWRKPNGIGSNALDRPSHAYENVLLFSKSRTYFYNRENSREPAVDGGTRLLRDVWDIPVGDVAPSSAGFPLALADRMVLLSTAIGDAVLDPFSGGATTGEAALRRGRSYVGVEPSAQYHNAAGARLATVMREEYP